MSPTMIIDMVLLGFAVVLAFAAVEVRNLYSSVMLASTYSLVMACFWTVTDALDVAYTEAAVGAGISTILLIGALVLTGEREIVRKVVHWPALITCALVGALLVYGTLDMPRFGDRNAPAHEHPVYEKYTKQTVPKDPSGKSYQDVLRYEEAHAEEHAHGQHHDDNFFHGHVPNQVTSIIVAYRGYDTMFETCVTCTAGIGMILLLRGRKRKPGQGGLL
jgi:multicomponent Na+:H+ antiporter subunit B